MPNFPSDFISTDISAGGTAGMAALGRDPSEIWRFIRVDPNGRVYCTLDDEQLERVASKLAELMAGKLIG